MKEAFVDKDMTGDEWHQALTESLSQTFEAQSGAEAYAGEEFEGRLGHRLVPFFLISTEHRRLVTLLICVSISCSPAIPRMLAKLHDPWTRFLPPAEFASFSMSNDGDLQGVGLLIAPDPKTGHLRVVAPIGGR